MRIGIVSAGGNGNLGDELFLVRWRQLFADCEVLPVFPGVDLASFDRLIIGGGDLADLRAPPTNIWYPAFLARPCFIYGVGTLYAGPAPQIISFLAGCRAVYARDRASAAKLRARGACVTGVVHDLLWAIDLPRYQPAHSWERACGLAMRREYPITPAQFAAIGNAVARRNLSLQLMPLQAQSLGASDYQLHLAKLMLSAGCLSPWLHPLVRAAACGWPDVLVTTRIHAALFALRAGKRVVPLFWPDRTGNRFTAICEAAGIGGLTKPHWTEEDIGAAIDASRPADVAHLEREAREQQLAFREEVLACR